ncbi:hypothetical protein [Mangrovibacterium lignilyticum]|uniref:hypothetical protein n=1 Tax=Mangrovibacterium lignilyticum TaxID=2668052 RepID=UPI0013D16BA7|nr:hypothetical protein [Mangrovibacterium lignilyticum]
MEDYIFIIIAIVLSVFGAMNQQKKKREQAMRGMDDEEERTSNSIFDQLFEDDVFMTGNPQEMVSPPIVKPAPPKKEKMKAPVKMEAPARMAYKPIKREGLKHSYVREERKSTSLELEKLQKEDESKFRSKNFRRKDFSLRKAVIYSEILNRKY